MTLAQFNRIVLCSVALLVSTATGSRADLATDAQQAINRGIIAAKQQDYLLAIRYFEEARKITPDAPEIYYDLGLAESKIAGRELRAIAWFGAYLAASPSTPNAAAVKGEIDRLDVVSQSNLSRLIKTAQDTTGRISADKKVGGLTAVSQLWADIGDIQAALKSAELIYVQSDADRPNSYDIKTEMVRPRLSDKNRVLAYIAKVQANAKDITGARNTADLIRDADDKSEAQASIAEAQAEAGDVAGAQKTVGSIKRSGPGLVRINFAQSAIAIARAKAGDGVGAQRTADLIEDAQLRQSAQDSIAAALAEGRLRAGDYLGAQSAASLIRDAWSRNHEQEAIAEAQATRRSTAEEGVSNLRVILNRWLRRLDDSDSNCALDIDPIRDLASSLKSLPPSDDPNKLLDPFLGIVRKIASAQICVDRLLKQQAKQGP